MSETAVTLLVAIFSSNGLFSLIVLAINRHYSKKEQNEERWKRLEQTLASVTYNQLSDKIEKLLDQGYATPDQRRELKISFDAYKANDWNGDMDERMEKVYSLPTKDLKASRDIAVKLP